MISVVIPTYNEKENIKWVIQGVDDALSGREHEIVVVDDDSPDSTSAEVIEMQDKANVRLVKRVGERGLGSAVARGFREASGDVLAVLDADGSHPPKVLARMADKIDEGFDLVFASRNIYGGGVEGWPLARKIISRVASVLAYGLTPATDPMSGYFMLKKSVIDGVELTPTGYKIGLEILVKGQHERYGEVPYTFKNRRAGESKLGISEYMNYLKHLVSLYAHKLRDIIP